MKNITKTYTIDDLVVKWAPGKCIHAGICAHGLPSVFDPRKKPWVNVDGAQKEEIYNQVKKCPSGALSAQMDERV
jgi:uncharacterized Fe-S cluster protein YjdI